MLAYSGLEHRYLFADSIFKILGTIAVFPAVFILALTKSLNDFTFYGGIAFDSFFYAILIEILFCILEKRGNQENAT